MLVNQDFKLLDVYNGLVNSKKARVFYVDSLGNKERKKSFSEHPHNEEAKILFFDYMGNQESCMLYKNQEVLLEGGWKSFNEISKGEKLIVFEALTTTYGGTELLLIPCDIKNITPFVDKEPLDLDLGMCIVNRANIREAV